MNPTREQLQESIRKFWDSLDTEDHADDCQCGDCLCVEAILMERYEPLRITSGG